MTTMDRYPAPTRTKPVPFLETDDPIWVGPGWLTADELLAGIAEWMGTDPDELVTEYLGGEAPDDDGLEHAWVIYAPQDPSNTDHLDDWWIWADGANPITEDTPGATRATLLRF